MLAPGVPDILAEFKTSNDQVATFVVSIFVLGFAVGPLLFAPLSELYGRMLVYHVCNSLFVVFSAACALSTSAGMLLAFRFLAGFVGVAVVTCGSGTIADLMPPQKRGAAMSVWSLGPLLGPVVGPVCAGFLVEAMGWRWVFWVITIAVSEALMMRRRRLMGGSPGRRCFSRFWCFAKHTRRCCWRRRRPSYGKRRGMTCISLR